MARVEPVVEPVLVAGAGAVGSVIGGLLAARGWPVTLVGRPDHLDAIRRDGLRVEGLFGEHHVRGLECVTDVLALRGTFRIVLLTVKSWDTAAMAFAVEKRLAPDGHLLSLQNGLGNLERTAAIVGDRRVLGGRVIFGAEIVEPGRVRVTVEAAPVLIGSPDPDDAARVAAAAAGRRRWPTPASRRAARPRSSPSCGRRRCTTPPSTPWARCSACRTATCRPTATPAPSWTTSWTRPSPSPAPRASVCPGPTPTATGGCSMASSCRRRRAIVRRCCRISSAAVRPRSTPSTAIWCGRARRHGVATPVNATLARVIRARVRLERDRVLPPLALTRSTLDDMLAHARETGAEECCGAVVTRDGRRARDPLRQRPERAPRPRAGRPIPGRRRAPTRRAPTPTSCSTRRNAMASSSRSSTIRIRRAARTSLRRTGREPCSATSRRIPT